MSLLWADMTLADYRKVIDRVPVLCVDVDLRAGDKHVLFKRRNEPKAGEWWTLGGRVYKGEMGSDAAVRKLREEAGIDVLPSRLRFAGYYERVFDVSYFGPGKYHAVSLVFECPCDPGQIRLDEQHSEWQLFDALPEELTARWPKTGGVCT